MVVLTFVLCMHARRPCARLRARVPGAELQEGRLRAALAHHGCASCSVVTAQNCTVVEQAHHWAPFHDSGLCLGTMPSEQAAERRAEGRCSACCCSMLQSLIGHHRRRRRQPGGPVPAVCGRQLQLPARQRRGRVPLRQLQRRRHQPVAHLLPDQRGLQRGRPRCGRTR